MASLLPQSRRPVRQIQIQKQNIPLDQIIAVRGQSPLATGIETAGNVLSQALQRREELRQQGIALAKQKEQTTQIARSLGLSDQDFSSLSPDQAIKVGEFVSKQKEKQASLPKIRLLEQQAGVAPGSYGDDYDAAKLIFTQSAIDKRMRENPNLDLRREGLGRAEDDKFKNRLNNQKNRLINDPRVKPLFAQDIGLKQVGQIQSLVQGGNTVAASALGTKMARAMGEVGVLTDQDVARYVVSGRLDRMAADKLSKWMRGVPSDATQAEISQIASTLSDNFSEKVQPVYNEYIDSFSQVEGMTPDEVSKKMGIPYQPKPLTAIGIEKKATHRWNPVTGRVEAL